MIRETNEKENSISFSFGIAKITVTNTNVYGPLNELM